MMAVFVLKSMTQSAVCLKSILKTQETPPQRSVTA